ncbi:MAG: response regulator [Pirellulales bacterium]|nr:response regulator [Pirellulales bacterium]
MEIKALVANSSNEARKNITRSLNEIGVNGIAEANDRKQAVELLQKGQFDVVFADYNSQGNEAEELGKAVRKLNHHTPIIVTAPQTKKVEELKKACPTASTYLTMPFTTEQLRKTMRECIPTVAG